MKLAVIIFDALDIDLIRSYNMKNLEKMYMTRNADLLTSFYPHTNPSNLLIWSGQHRNYFWFKNQGTRWIDPGRLSHVVHGGEMEPDVDMYTMNDYKDINFIWEILEANGYKSRAVQIPIVLPPYSYNAVEEAKDWFPNTQEGCYNNLRAKEKITMNALKDISEGKLDFYCTSFPQPDKLLHGVGENWATEDFLKSELLYLDKVAEKIDSYCNKHNIVYLLFGDHGAPGPDGDNFGKFYKQKIAVVRHRKHSVIMSNHKDKIPQYTDEIFPFIINYYNINLENTKNQIIKTKEIKTQSF